MIVYDPQIKLVSKKKILYKCYWTVNKYTS